MSSEEYRIEEDEQQAEASGDVPPPPFLQIVISTPLSLLYPLSALFLIPLSAPILNPLSFSLSSFPLASPPFLLKRVYEVYKMEYDTLTYTVMFLKRTTQCLTVRLTLFTYYTLQLNYLWVSNSLKICCYDTLYQ